MKTTAKKKKHDSLFKRVSAWLHLWLGLTSGIIVLIVSLTGAIYVFQKELTAITQPWTQAPVRSQSQLPPSMLVSSVVKTFPGFQATGLRYGAEGESAEVNAYDRKTLIYDRVFVDPYSGGVLKRQRTDYKSNSGDFDFFVFILNGHRALWLPYPIGRPIVGVAVLIFVVLLISGLVLWWPKKWTRATREKSFKVKWTASFKRLNYDLHNVFGFYSMVFLFIIALTGLIWSFQWVSTSVYWATSGGRSLKDVPLLMSDTTAGSSFQMKNLDRAWAAIMKNDQPQGMYIGLPGNKASLVNITAYLRAGTYYKTNVYQYDQYTFKALKSAGPYSGRYADARAADKLRQMNYDIHVGAIFGIPGKIIAFILAMISASLPVTGFYVWWGKRRKKAAPKVKVLRRKRPEKTYPLQNPAPAGLPNYSSRP